MSTSMSKVISNRPRQGTDQDKVQIRPVSNVHKNIILTHFLVIISCKHAFFNQNFKVEVKLMDISSIASNHFCFHSIKRNSLLIKLKRKLLIPYKSLRQISTYEVSTFSTLLLLLTDIRVFLLLSALSRL